MSTEAGGEKCARNFGLETCSEDVTNRANFFDFMFQLNAPFVYYIYQLPLHVSSSIVLIIRRIHCIHTASGSLYVTLLR